MKMLWGFHVHVELLGDYVLYFNIYERVIVICNLIHFSFGRATNTLNIQIIIELKAQIKYKMDVNTSINQTKRLIKMGTS